MLSKNTLRMVAVGIVMGLPCLVTGATLVTWSGNNTTDWFTAANWVGGIAPQNSLTANIAQFTSGNYTNQPFIGSDTQINGLSLTATSGNVLLNGSATLTLGDGGITMVSGGIGNFTLAANVLLGANQSWTNNSGMLFSGNKAISISNTVTLTLTSSGNGVINLSGNISGLGGLTLAGSGGPTVLSGNNTFSGGLNLNSGVLNVSSDTNLGVSTGALNMNGGTLQWGSFFSISASRPITLNAGGNFDTNGFSGTIARAMTGTGNLTKLGAGTLILTGANSYSGGTRVSAGTLQGNTTTLNGAIVNNAAVVFNQDFTGTYSGIMSGTGNLTMSGTGNLTLSAVNTYSGGTNFNGGAVFFTNDNNLGATNAPLFFNGGTLRWGFNGNLGTGRAINLIGDGTFDTNGFNTTIAQAIGGAGNLIKTGSGTLTSNAVNQYDGTTTINQGTLQLGDGNNPGTFGDGDVTISNNATVVFNFIGQGPLTINNSIGGTGNLIKLGAGTLWLTGTNAYSGGTTVSAGILEGNSVSLQGSITNNATVIFSQGIAGNFTGTISGNGNVVTIGTQTLGFNNSNTYTGNTTIGNGVLLMNNANAIPGGIAATGGTSNLIFATNPTGGVLGLRAGNFARDLGTGPAQVQWTGSGGFAAYGGNRTVNIGGNLATMTWGAGGFVPSGSVLLLGAVDADSTVTFQNPINLNGAARTFQVDRGTGSGPDALLSGNISGAGPLVKTDNGILSMNGTNSYTGGTTINSGILQVGSDSNLGGTGTGTGLTFGGGTLQWTAPFDLNGNRTINLNSSSGTLDTNGFNVSANKVISGNGGSLTKAGAGTLTLGAVNTYTGTTTIANGVLQMGIANALNANTAVQIDSLVPNALDLFNFNLAIGSLSGKGDVALGSGTLTVGANNLDSQHDGVISGSGGLIKIGDGSLTLTGSNLYTGPTTVNGGSLFLDYSTNNTPKIANNTITMGGATLSLRGNGGSNTVQNAGNLVLTSGNSFIVLDSSSTPPGYSLTLNLGQILPSSGALVDFSLPTTGGNVTTTTANASGLGYLGTWATVNGTAWAANDGSGRIVAFTDYLVENNVANWTNNANISNNEAYYNSTGNLTLQSLRFNAFANSLVTIDSGATLTLAAGGGIMVTKDVSIGLSQISGGSLTSAGAQLNIIQNNTSEQLLIDSNIVGSLALLKNGPGKLTLTGNNTYSLGTTVFAGTLQGTTDSLKGAITNNGTVIFNQDFTGNYASVMSGTGNLVKTGLGTLILTNTNTYTGLTTIDAGTLQALNLSGNVVNNASLLFNDSLTGSYTGSISGPGNVTKNGAGTLTLSAANTYGGGTILNQGILTINNAGAFGSGQVTFNGGTLQAAGAYTLANDFSWSGNAAIAGAQTITLNGTSIFTTNLTLTANRNLTFGATTAGGLVKIGNGSVLTLTGNSPVIFTGLISEDAGSPGGLTINTASTVTLKGNNTYSGVTTLAAGTAIVNSDTAFGVSTVNFNAGTMLVNDAPHTLANNMTYAGTAAFSGNFALTLSGNQTLQANTILNTSQSSTSPFSVEITGVIGDLGANRTLTATGNACLILSGSNTYTGNTLVTGGVLRLNNANAISASNLALSGGGIVELTPSSGDFTRALGATGNTVRWTSNGGFSAFGGNFSVNLGGAGAPVTWASGNFVPTNMNLTLGSVYSSGTVTFVNPINLNGANRTIQSDRGTGTGIDAVLSGNISNSSGAFGIIKTGTGSLSLTGNNTYNGTTQVSGGVLLLASANALPGGVGLTGGTSNLSLTGGVIGLTTATGNFSRALGSSGNQVQITSGGFAAYGGNWTVAIGGNATTALTWGIGGFVASGNLILGASTADSTVTFVNPINLNGATRTIQSDRGTGTGIDAVLSGNISNSSGSFGIVKTGTGVLSLTGNNTYNGSTQVNGGVLLLTSANALPGGVGLTGGTSNLILAGGVIGLTPATGDFNRALGSSGTQVQWIGNGGFAAYGANRTVNIGGAAAQLVWTTTGSFLSANQVLILGSSTADSTVTFANPLNLNVNTGQFRSILVDDGTAAIDAIVSGSLTNTGNMTTGNIFYKSGAGTLLLTGNNASLTGNTVIQNGALAVSSSAGLPATTLLTTGNLITSGKLILGNLTAATDLTLIGLQSAGTGTANSVVGGGPTVATLTLNLPASVTYTYNGTFGGTGTYENNLALIFKGSGATGGTMILGGGPSSYTGNTNLQFGTVVLQGGDNRLSPATTLVLGSGANSGRLVLGDGTNPSNQTLAGLLTSGSGTTNVVVGGGLTNANLTINIASGVNTYSGLLGGTTGTNDIKLTLIKAGSGNLVLTNNNTFNGGIVMQAGLLESDNINAFGLPGINAITFTDNSTAVVRFNLTAATSAATGNNVSVGPISTGLVGGTPPAIENAGPNPLTVNVDTGTGTSTYGGILREAAGGGILSLTKTNTGSLILTGNSTYTGNTTVAQGTLLAGMNAPAGGPGPFGNSTYPIILTNFSTLANSVALFTNGPYTIGRDIIVAPFGLSTTVSIGGNTAVSSSFNGTITLTKNTAGNITNLYASNNGTVIFNGQIREDNWNPPATNPPPVPSNGIRKDGPGTVVLNQYNTFSGGIYIKDGVLKVGSVGGLNSAGYNAVYFDSNSTGILRLNGTPTVTVAGLFAYTPIASPVIENASNNATLLNVQSTTTVLTSSFAGLIQDGTGTGALSLLKNENTSAGTVYSELTLSGNNTYTGNTTVARGTLVAGFDVPLGGPGAFGNSSSPIVLVTVSPVVTGNYNVGLLTGGPFSIGRPITANFNSSQTGTVTIGGKTNDNSFFTGNINLQGILTSNRTLQLTSNTTGTNTVTISGVINAVGATGPRGINMIGPGTVTLAAANTYNGTTTISNGVLLMSNPNAIPGGIGTTGGTSNLIFTSSNATLPGGVLGLGTGNFTRALGTTGNTVQWTGSGGFAAYGGNRTVTISGNSALKLTWNGTNFVPAAASLILGSSGADGTLLWQNPIDLSTGLDRTIQVNRGLVTGPDAILSGILSSTGTSGLIKTGDGILSLTATNTYTGNTTVAQGTLLAGANSPAGAPGAFGNSTNPITLTTATTTGNVALLTDGPYTVGRDIAVANNGVSVTIGGNSQSSSTFSGNIVLSRDVILSSVTTGEFTTTFSGVISDTGVFNAVTKTGSGTATLTGNNTFSGGITVNEGSLLVNNTVGSGTGTGSVTVNIGSKLGGTGFIVPGDSAFINIGSNGILAPGTSGNTTTGTLTFDLVAANNVGVTLSSGATLSYKLGASSDLLRFYNYDGSTARSLNLNANVVSFNTLSGFDPVGTYTLMNFYADNGVTPATNGPLSGLVLDPTFTALYPFSYLSYSGSTVTLNMVPEPGSLALLAFGTLGVLRFRRKKAV